MQRLFVLREPHHLAGLVAFLGANWQSFAREGKYLAVTVGLHKDKRSLEQNRRYFGPAVLGAIAEQAWLDGRRFSKDAWHEYLKREFIGQIELPGGGVLAMSSSDLNVEQFSQYMQQVEVYAAQQLGVIFEATF
jgi:hypothetical protein